MSWNVPSEKLPPFNFPYPYQSTSVPPQKSLDDEIREIYRRLAACEQKLDKILSLLEKQC